MEEHQRLRAENASLRDDVADRRERIRALEAKVLELNQVRQDVGKRIDNLVAQIDTLDTALGSQGSR